MTKFEDEIKKSGCIVYKNSGNSMMPLLRENRDLAVISEIKSPPVKYDTVLFRRENGSYVLHRIFGVRDDYYLIGGDNRCFEEKIPKTQLIGVLTAVIRDGRQINTTDGEYLEYLKKLPRRRAALKFRAALYRPIKALKGNSGKDSK